MSNFLKCLILVFVSSTAFANSEMNVKTFNGKAVDNRVDQSCAGQGDLVVEGVLMSVGDKNALSMLVKSPYGDERLLTFRSYEKLTKGAKFTGNNFGSRGDSIEIESIDEKSLRGNFRFENGMATYTCPSIIELTFQ
jgi:hypothetical protein